jgi:hypothetical protein
MGKVVQRIAITAALLALTVEQTVERVGQAQQLARVLVA